MKEIQIERQATILDDDLVIYFDTLMLAPRDYREAELVFILQRDNQVLPEPKPRLVRMAGLSPDFEEPFKQRMSFNYTHTLKAQDPPLNLIIEIRVSDPTDPTNIKSTAWTVMPLFNPA